MSARRETISDDAAYQDALQNLLRAAIALDRFNRRSPYHACAKDAFVTAQEALAAAIDFRISKQGDAQ